jgi:SAM-dependent methyltransferase
MRISEYKRMEEYEKKYWWHLGRLEIVRKQLALIQQDLGKKNLRILNIGCGTGGTVPMLESFGEVFNVDTEKLAIELLRKNGFKNGVVVKGNKLPYADGYFDLVVAMDVLEHIDAEGEALKEWRRVLTKRGEILITVPAYSWLWSNHDVALHHFRRYNKSQGRVALISNGLTCEKLSYMIVFSLPLVIGFRFLHKLGPPRQETSYVDLPAPANWFFTKLLIIESSILKYVSLPFGSSLMLRAKKK